MSKSSARSSFPIPDKKDPDPKRPVRLISAINRIYRYCGLNDLEQLEDAPEYDPKVALNAERVKQYLAWTIKEPA